MQQSTSGKLFRLAVRKDFGRGQAMELQTIVDDGRAELEAQHSLESEVEALDLPSSESFRGSGSDETDLLVTKPFLTGWRRRIETMLDYHSSCFQTTTGFYHAHHI